MFKKFFQRILGLLWIDQTSKLSWSADDCVKIIIARWTFDKYKSDAWERLRRLQGDSYREFFYQAIVDNAANNNWKLFAAAEILKSKEPSQLALQSIITFGPEENREEAWKKLLESNPGETPFWHLIYYHRIHKATPRKWRERAREYLMQRRPNLKMSDFEEWLPN